MPASVPLISLEEHFLAPEMRAHHSSTYSAFPDTIVNALLDLGQGRLEAMDEGSMQKAVLSHGPGTGDIEACKAANDLLAKAVRNHPDRLAGFATLPMLDPQAAAEELARCVEDLGFVGTLVENHAEGKFLDGDEYEPFWARAEQLDVPVYIHPSLPSEEMHNALYKGNYDERTAFALGAFGWGWHAETGLHFLRLYASGLFDRHPKLKIVLGHNSEMLAFQMDRCIAQDRRSYGKHERSLQTVWTSNVWITTSGMFSLTPLQCALQTTTPDRVMLSVDYPFSKYGQGLEFFEKVKGSGLLTEEQVKDFGWRNAAKLLKL